MEANCILVLTMNLIILLLFSRFLMSAIIQVKQQPAANPRQRHLTQGPLPEQVINETGPEELHFNYVSAVQI